MTEWIECDNCGGDGFTDHDCGEDTCACAEPETNVACFVCNGDGWWANEDRFDPDAEAKFQRENPIEER